METIIRYIKPTLFCLAVVYGAIELVAIASTVRLAKSSAECEQVAIKNHWDADQALRQIQSACKQVEPDARVIEGQLNSWLRR